MKLRHIGLGLALAAAIWLSFFHAPHPTASVVEPLIRPTTENGKQSASAEARLPNSDDESPAAETLTVLKLRDRTDSHERSGNAEGMFSNRSWAPPPPPPVVIKPEPPPPPSAPPMPFTYLGKIQEDGVWRVFLARGDQTYVAKTNAVLDGTYRIASISPPVLSIVFMPLNQTQTVTIGSAE